MTERIVAKHESEVPPMRSVGFIGGMSLIATIDILKRIKDASVAYLVPQYGNRGYPPIILYSINKAPMVLNPDGSYPEKLEPSSTLLEAARFVGEKSEFIILGSHTAHLFKKQIEKAAGKPLLSLVDLTIEEVKKRKCKKVGLIAIGVTIRDRLYQGPLKEIGVESIILPEELARKLDNEGVYLIQEGGDPKNGSQIAYDALDYFNKQGVDGVILGCTEIPILLGERASEANIINPSQLLAEAVIKKAMDNNYDNSR
ncbi:MAG: hypothetical protein A2W22_04480 [Candidatus Levybacteria bacterium RBG_16_35_11]|nr:MAG: hypothetical protein A2W22_04480 [Candidatus Levybacteria bacterium RBG_16_35_11]